MIKTDRHSVLALFVYLGSAEDLDTADELYIFFWFDCVLKVFVKMERSRKIQVSIRFGLGHVVSRDLMTLALTLASYSMHNPRGSKNIRKLGCWGAGSYLIQLLS